MNPKQIEDFFHLSPVQKQLLRHSEQAAPPTHLAQFSCQLEGQLDVSAFDRAWQKMTNRQPGLRMTFVSGDLKEPVQIVNRNVGVELEKHDWRNLSEVDQTQRLQELLRADRQSGFVLQTAPLWRMLLIRLGEERYHFVWTYHELLFDERALPGLFNEALAHYEAILKGKTEPLLLPVSFRKYIEWGRKQDARAAENFWRKYLAGVVAPTPIEWTRRETSVQLAADTTATLKALAAQHRLAPEVFVYGAWALLLSRLSGLAEVLFGITISGRSPALPGANRLIGHLRNTLPLRVRILPQATALEWLTDLQCQWDELQRYSFHALTQIQGWSEIPPPQPLFQSVVVFDAAHVEAVINRDSAGLQIRQDHLLLPPHFPLVVLVKDLDMSWELRSNAQTVQLHSLLEQFARFPRHSLADLALPLAEQAAASPTPQPPPLVFPTAWLPQSEEEQGWVDWLKAESCAHELFEAQVTRAPDAIAVRLNGRALTYEELNARANQLARYLRKLNVVPSIPVGLCFTPSIEAVVGMLGVLKAGGAYLPLDPTLATERLQQFLNTSAVSVLLTQTHLEPNFRTIPVNHLVLCLDGDWQIIAAEETENLLCQVSDDHPACLLTVAEAPAVITHARLAKAVGGAPEWFRFEGQNPWHLFGPLQPEPAPDFPDAWDSFDLTPEPSLETWSEPHLGLIVAPESGLDEILEPEPGLELTPVLVPELELEQLLEPELELDEILAPELEAQPAMPALAPLQQWFFAQHPLSPQHCNLSLLVEIGDTLEQTTLAQALQTVVARHAALRWRFTQTAVGWRLDDGVELTALPFEYVDFSAKWARSQRRAIEEAADKLQTSLHLTTGPLWGATYFDLGADRSHRLLIIAHQLIADETSLRIFLHDWLTTYWQLRRGQAPSLPPKTVSYQEWLQTLAASAQPAELKYWQQLKARSLQALPIDHPEGANTYGQVDRVFVSLNSKETESLLHPVPLAAEADVNEVVLTALTLALAQWAGESAALLELERSAREGLDVAHTMGWFATKFPVWLEVENVIDVTAALCAVKAQLRALPRGGLSYGLWRYNNAAETVLRDLPQPKVSFKYLAFPPDEPAWRVASESVGLEHHPHNERNVIIAVTGAMNLNMLEFRWEYAREQFEQKNIGLLVNGFIEELRKLIAHFAKS